MFNKTISILMLMLIGILSYAQSPQTYKGAYANGYAEYNYIENDKLMKLWNGRFTYKDTMEVAGRGECDVLINGAYKDDQKSAIWVATIKGLDGNSLETSTGPMKDGMKIGLWTHRLTMNDKYVKVASASFTRDRFTSKFEYKYNPLDASIGEYQELNVVGSFDSKGMLDGEWTTTYVGKDGVRMQELARYQHGVLAFRVVHELETGIEKDRYDKEAFVTDFWSKMKLPDSNAVINDEKYGVIKEMCHQESLVPLMNSWNDLRTVVVSNIHGSSIPTMMITKGEVQSNKYLVCEQKIVPWNETPKGMLEWQEEQRILKEYQSNIANADKALEEKNLEEALRLYRLSSTIKKDEDYPREQIPMVEQMIKDRATQNRLLGSVGEKKTMLDKTQKKLMDDETFMKKQDKLYEAYDMAYSARMRSMKSDHSKTMTFIENDNIEPISILELEAYEASLDELIQLQNKVSLLVGQDTKDLEKELKKLDDTGEIEKMLRR